ncbi:MAG: hypothetical protein ACFE9D_00495 [Promethearchaeota archaeon]
MTKKKGFLQRRWTDFRTGHSTYLVYFLAFMNFSILMYELVLVNIPGMQLLFPNILYFLLVFLAIYIPLAAIIGWLHRRYQMPVDIALSMKQNPYWRDITKSLAEFEKGMLLIAQAKNNEAITILQNAIKRLEMDFA